MGMRFEKSWPETAKKVSNETLGKHLQGKWGKDAGQRHEDVIQALALLEKGNYTTVLKWKEYPRRIRTVLIVVLRAVDIKDILQVGPADRMVAFIQEVIPEQRGLLMNTQSSQIIM